jgi:hypothetical protein
MATGRTPPPSTRGKSSGKHVTQPRAQLFIPSAHSTASSRLPDPVCDGRPGFGLGKQTNSQTYLFWRWCKLRVPKCELDGQRRRSSPSGRVSGGQLWTVTHPALLVFCAQSPRLFYSYWAVSFLTLGSGPQRHLRFIAQPPVVARSLMLHEPGRWKTRPSSPIIAPFPDRLPGLALNLEQGRHGRSATPSVTTREAQHARKPLTFRCHRLPICEHAKHVLRI